MSSESTGTSPMQGAKESSSVTPGRACLVLLHALDRRAVPDVFRLEADIVLIGREPTPGGLAIPQSAVSRLHARLSWMNGQWSISDLDSRNGVIVNGSLVRETTLEHLDEIRIGDAIYKLVVDDADTFFAARQERSGELIGGVQISKILSDLERVAPTELTVLVLGETGTGKELAARAVHRASGRKGTFCALNCAAIPSNLLESELFGFKRGAFTGADRDKPGLVRSAQGGTLMLDEIGDMPLEAQAKLLRMIEMREVLPLGATIPEKIDVRLVCATHRNLRRLVKKGSFRGDLFARINGYAVTLPPLRERKEDLHLLVRHFLAQNGRADLELTFPLMVALCNYDWPYNVRELETTIRRAVAVARSSELDTADLPDDIREAMAEYGKPAIAATPTKLAPSGRMHAPTEEQLRALLTQHAGNIAAVARDLHRDRAQIHRWIRRYVIDPDEFRDPSAR